MSQGRTSKRISVYRMYQFTRNSPCLLGTPCATCARYAEEILSKTQRYYFRGAKYVCERAVPATPAFYVTRRQALSLLFNQLAVLIHDGWALELTFSVVTNMRDASSKADEHLVMAYLAGSYRARIAIEQAWSSPPPFISADLSRPVPIYPFA
ncbi:MAG TPA: hypothetical protein VJV96_00730 [Candidatus Angelobacter sp.]|nr:hypothetical protein [Candidatus Angelobacter sp.]